MADGESKYQLKFIGEDGPNKESHTDFITGRLKKRGRFSTKWYRCDAKLERDCFVYKRDDKQKTKLICLIDVQLEQDEANDCVFILTYKVNKKRFIFKAPTKEDCDKWMEVIFDAIIDGKQNRKDQSEACTLQ